MSDLIYHDRLKESKDLLALAQKAAPTLEEIAARSERLARRARSGAGVVQAEWDRIEDAHGSPLVTLKLHDAAEAPSFSFTPQALALPSYVQGRAYQLWDDLLAVRTEESLRKLFDEDEPGGN